MQAVAQGVAPPASVVEGLGELFSQYGGVLVGNEEVYPGAEQVGQGRFAGDLAGYKPFVTRAAA